MWNVLSSTTFHSSASLRLRCCVALAVTILHFSMVKLLNNMSDSSWVENIFILLRWLHQGALVWMMMIANISVVVVKFTMIVYFFFTISTKCLSWNKYETGIRSLWTWCNRRIVIIIVVRLASTTCNHPEWATQIPFLRWWSHKINFDQWSLSKQHTQ